MSNEKHSDKKKNDPKSAKPKGKQDQGQKAAAPQKGEQKPTSPSN